MGTSVVYAIISVLALMIIGIIFLNKRNAFKKLPTPLTGVAYSMILCGIIFGNDRWVGYTFIGIGVALSVIEMIRTRNMNIKA